MSIRVAPGELSATLQRDQERLPRAVNKAFFKAAHRARGTLAKASPVDRGVLKNAWKVVRVGRSNLSRWASGSSWEVLNDAPYAGIVERGIRPGAKFGRAAFESIRAWVIRVLIGGASGMKKAATKYNYFPRGRRGAGGREAARHAALGEVDREVDRITWSIIKKLEREGREGRFFVRKALPHLATVLTDMVHKEIADYYAKGGGAKR